MSLQTVTVPVADGRRSSPAGAGRWPPQAAGFTVVHPFIQGKVRWGDASLTRPTAVAGAQSSPRQAPELPAPKKKISSVMLMIRMESLFQEVQKSLTQSTQKQITRTQDAHQALLKIQLKKLVQRVQAEIAAEANRKQARVFGLLFKIASTVMTTVVLAAIAASTPLTGPAGFFLFVGCLSAAGAVVDLVGSASAAKKGGEGFTLGTLLKRGGVRKGSEALSCALTLNLGGLTAECLKETKLKGEGVLAISILVSIAQAFLMVKATAKWADPGKLGVLMRSVVKGTQQFSLGVGGMGQFLAGACTIDAAQHQYKADKRRSEMTGNDADMSQMNQFGDMNIEFMQTLLQQVEQSFSAARRLIEDWERSMSQLVKSPVRSSAMA